MSFNYWNKGNKKVTLLHTNFAIRHETTISAAPRGTSLGTPFRFGTACTEKDDAPCRTLHLRPPHDHRRRQRTVAVSPLCRRIPRLRGLQRRSGGRCRRADARRGRRGGVGRVCPRHHARPHPHRRLGLRRGFQRTSTVVPAPAARGLCPKGRCRGNAGRLRGDRGCTAFRLPRNDARCGADVDRRS